MTKLDQFFPEEATIQEHPEMKKWKERIESPEFEKLFELKRERDGLTYRPAIICVHIKNKESNDECIEKAVWDADLNDSLIDRGIRAITIENEEERFGLMLKKFLEKPEIRFGGGFFNTVLVETLRSNGFGSKDAVKEKLDEIAARFSSSKGSEFDECTGMIEGIVKRCGYLLTRRLSYTRDEAEDILSGAIAYYLDERFSITNRKLLGFK